jgi:MFS-type transporter involved in bile tolerance (Atg22 family)
LAADTIPKEKISTTSGIISFMGFVGALLGTQVGFIMSITKSNAIGYAILMIIMIIGAMITISKKPSKTSIYE